jgi:signal recognition particle receptor subunit beta
VATVDFHERQLTLKLVYYGPPLSGKTSNLRWLYGRVDRAGRGRLMTLDTRDDRTLFFDLLPIFFRSSNFSFAIKVYTVPGQPMHEATRRVVLDRADGVVFVADSAPDQEGHNREAWAGLARHLGALGLTRIPTILQYNKRDLVDAVPLDTPLWPSVAGAGAPELPVFPAQATSGVGVVETFFALVERAWGPIEADLKLSSRFGIDAATFRAALAAHVGIG